MTAAGEKVDNRTLIIEECKKHFNEPVLMHTKLGRLIGFGEDWDDYYYIVMHMGGEVVWYSAVGGFYALDRLKGQEHVKAYNGEEWDDFFRLDNMLNLNNCPKADVMRMECIEDTRLINREKEKEA